MGKKWTNQILPGALHFVTGNVLDRRKIFTVEANCTAFCKALQEMRERECKLIAFVLMPDHFHITINPRNGNVQESVNYLKSKSAKRSNLLFEKTGQVWQESFKSLPLWSPWMINQKINYIHSNPVRAGIVSAAEDHRWSSFRAFYFEEVDPLLQADKEWWWPEDVKKLEIANAEKQKVQDEKFLNERNKKIQK
jgi:putative transposase